MGRVTVGQAIIRILEEEKVPYLFGLVGSSFLDVLDALYDTKRVQYISVRHEQAGAYMADGFARASGLPGAVIATNGPGVVSLVPGITCAYMAHSPVVAICSTGMSSHLYRGSFQEVDQVSLLRPITKFVAPVNRPDRVPDILRHALRLATSGKQGPTAIDIPRDILNRQEVDAEFPPSEEYRPPQRVEGDSALVSRSVEVLLQAKTPVIIAGGGVGYSEATEALLAVAEHLAAPIVSSFARLDVVPHHHSQYIGQLGRSGSPEAATMVQRADVILAIGTRLSHMTTFYDNRFIQRSARIVQIELDQQEIGRHFPVTVGIQGDAKKVLLALLTALRGHQVVAEVRERRLREARELKQLRQQRLDQEGTAATMPLKPRRAYHELRKAIPGDAAVVLDAGLACADGYDRLVFRRPRSFFAPLDYGGVGWSFPAALGVKLALPKRPVISIGGDGGFLMNSQELETAMRHNIPVVAIVMNNNCWGSEKAYQKYFYQERYIGSDISNPPLDQYARLFGARGYLVDAPDQLGDMLKDALQSGQPCVIELPIDPEELPVPGRAADAVG